MLKKDIIKKRGYVQNTNGDKLSLYISNYQINAEYLANRIGDKNKTIIELCCGIGITLKEYSKTFKYVLGIDINSKILNSCKKNLKSKDTNNVELIVADVETDNAFSNLKADVVVYDIPYWNIGLTKNTGLDKTNPDLKTLVNKIRKCLTENIVIITPPYFSYEEAIKLLGKCEYEKIFINNKHDRNHIYMGKLIKNKIQEVWLKTYAK